MRLDSGHHLLELKRQGIPTLLESSPPEHAAIARGLAKLARDLEIDRLLRLL